jgi:O-antigen ligase
VDAFVFLLLILSAISVLRRRRVRVSEIVQSNRWLTVFFVYCFLAILWSDFPFVAFKRWIKVLGHPLMVLVLFTEPDPEQALIRLFKRCAYILVPGSVLCIKYFPEIGRGYDAWSGQPSNKGLTGNKNELGYACLVLGFFYAWNFLKTLREPKSKARRDEILITGFFIYLIGWSLWMAHSGTSSISLLIGIIVMIFLGFSFIDRRLVGTYTVAAAIVIAIAQLGFDISTVGLKLLGKDPTLTDRTKVWHDVLQIRINPVLGAGFESFWLGERREKMWEKWNWQPNQAHNGYLETYLNLGVIGLLILLAVLLATFWKSRREFLVNFEFGRFRLGFLAAVLAYNWTEASFKALHPVWFVFYIIAIDFSRPQQSISQEISAESEENEVDPDSHKYVHTNFCARA